ncbi:MAG: sulfur carrier protein ThiS [Candidatus Schekmanbacteria bacterium]|nr:sulfur carrier protein ThiS [Candidatus Schekmanbacteria bacterium]
MAEENARMLTRVAPDQVARLRDAGRLTLIVNGEHYLPAPETTDMTISCVLEALSLSSSYIVVELNGTPLFRQEHATTLIRAGDRLELVRAVAGGAS